MERRCSLVFVRPEEGTRPACSPSDTAQAIKVTPIEDFVNNLVISQANFPVKDDKVRLH